MKKTRCLPLQLIVPPTQTAIHRHPISLKLLFLFLCLYLSIPKASAQLQSFVPPSIANKKIKQARNESDKIPLLLNLGRYYLDKSVCTQNDIDSAMIFYREAYQLSLKINSVQWLKECMRLKAVYFFKINDFQNAQRNFVPVIQYYEQSGRLVKAADAWNDYGTNISDEPKYGDLKLNCFKNAARLYSRVNDRIKETEALKNEADIHLNQGKLSLAKAELLKVLAAFQSLHYRNLHHTYYLLAAISHLTSDLHQELAYNLEAVKSVEASADTADASLFYFKLAGTYRDLDMYDKSVFYYKKSLSKFQDDDYDYYTVLQAVVQGLILQKKAKEAITFLHRELARFPTSELRNDRENMALANCFEALKNYNQAERYYLLMNQASDKMYQQQLNPIEKRYADLQQVCSFYITIRQYKKADHYLQQILTLPSNLVSPIIFGQLELYKFKIDSASGNLSSAIRHFENYKRINDSIFNATKSQQIAKLQISYEMAQKDKDILLLKKQSQIDQGRYEAKRKITNLVLIALVLLIILCGVLYNRYHLKQRSVVLLTNQRQIISEKNQKQERLLQENDWLLKEVHHRVKNNLQVVMNLLRSQSIHLKDEAALNAIKDSQHRIQAMSLIHQKLYKMENNSSVYMPEYIGELIDYLRESFKTGQKIRFVVDIEPISLDIVHAIPVGLIINELVTNSIKYAFPHSDQDQIHVSLCTGKPEVELMVADNGRGLPENFDVTKIDSFGITLVKGLIDELDGKFILESKGGTMIALTFMAGQLTHEQPRS